MAIITISRLNGSLGEELADQLKSRLQCEIITRSYALENFFGDLPAEVTERLNESAKYFLTTLPDSNETYKDILIKRLKQIASRRENIIIMGLGGCVIFKDDPRAVSIRVYADEKTRIDRLSRRYNIDEEEAESSIAIGDRKHKRFVSILFEQDLSSSDLYDLALNTDRLSVEECADAVMALISKHDLRQKISMETQDNKVIDHQTSNVVFKNPTEEEFARILDMYNIEWMYEPKTFPIEWDSEGNIKMAFSPDFYLPKFNIYLELTTMDQKYVTKKNKKARMVMELYPGTNVRIVYKKDFLALAERFKQFGG
ncbi:MAG: cytidylate kinase family protein [Saccharofermentans sp.]|nr:cytidylate kinase family protein [Saccharofermentans sp.]